MYYYFKRNCTKSIVTVTWRVSIVFISSDDLENKRRLFQTEHAAFCKMEIHMYGIYYRYSVLLFHIKKSTNNCMKPTYISPAL